MHHRLFALAVAASLVMADELLKRRPFQTQVSGRKGSGRAAAAAAGAARAAL